VGDVVVVVALLAVVLGLLDRWELRELLIMLLWLLLRRCCVAGQASSLDQPLIGMCKQLRLRQLHVYMASLQY
jgi:hypothetical protein